MNDITIAEMKKQLVEQIERQAEFRERKADEYPDDDRNRKSAVSLRKLAEQLAEFPTTDPKWGGLWSLYQENSDQVNETIIAVESEVLRGYGFHEEEDGNPAKFLDLFTDRVAAARGSDPVSDLATLRPGARFN